MYTTMHRQHPSLLGARIVVNKELRTSGDPLEWIDGEAKKGKVQMDSAVRSRDLD